MDEPSGGTLRFSGHWILTNVFVTQANILTSVSSILTYVKTSPDNRTLPYLFDNTCKLLCPNLDARMPGRGAAKVRYGQAGCLSNITASADHLVPAIVGAISLYQ